MSSSWLIKHPGNYSKSMCQLCPQQLTRRTKCNCKHYLSPPLSQSIFFQTHSFFASQLDGRLIYEQWKGWKKSGFFFVEELKKKILNKKRQEWKRVREREKRKSVRAREIDASPRQRSVGDPRWVMWRGPLLSKPASFDSTLNCSTNRPRVRQKSPLWDNYWGWTNTSLMRRKENRFVSFLFFSLFASLQTAYFSEAGYW